MDFQKYLECNFKYEEPIFAEELKQKLNANPNTIRQYLKKATDSGVIVRYALKNGIYYKPNPNALFRSSLNLYDVIKKKYLFDQNTNRIGYITGLSFANELRLTTQNALAYEIVTNRETMRSRKVLYGKNTVFLKKPRFRVNNANYKLLQVFDLVSNFELYCDVTMEESMEKILDYLKDVKISKGRIKKMLIFLSRERSVIYLQE
ncbi:hypothetical protein NBRC111894_4260 [Sporolactobacillus inulinus]|uniref:Uncharacterized protein n=1 Tax=Sporolactobacillus inulinus TaxID=2078 RepID=A0A4Y1ZHL5_9BACL|nr:hypothetical protein [Sporolactobacillus inulinus]GAY78706.1 hypothetical protein NBRC111894_4260 [Sporolactobacillus inulinus]